MLEDINLLEKYVLCGTECTCPKCVAWNRIKKFIEETAQQENNKSSTPSKCCHGYLVWRGEDLWCDQCHCIIANK